MFPTRIVRSARRGRGPAGFHGERSKVTSMTTARRRQARRSILLSALAGLGLAACGTGPGSSGGPVNVSTSQGVDRSTLAREARAALDQFYRQQPGARRLGDEADAILVFPSITQAGLGVGGLYGNGVMFQGGQPVGYYNIAGGTFGFQAGAQSYSQGYFFNSEEALATFRRTYGLEFGAGASAVAAEFGASGEITTSTLQKPLVVATWDQSGLMAAAVLQGAKITELAPPAPSS
jgi:lipid-binding SYLF domain-containing protein